jgi:hypothetical protein
VRTRADRVEGGWQITGRAQRASWLTKDQLDGVDRPGDVGGQIGWFSAGGGSGAV